jgi:TolA-binding protein
MIHFNIMKKIILCFSSILVFAACNNSNTAETKASKADLLNLANLYNDSLKQSQTLDMRLANAAMQSFENFITNNPSDSLAPVFQFRAARVAMNVGQFAKADILFKTCLQSYPNFKLKPDVLFLRAHLQDDFLNNDSLAKQLYNEFLVAYPKHQYTESAQGALSMLGKTDLQIVNEIEKKNK